MKKQTSTSSSPSTSTSTFLAVGSLACNERLRILSGFSVRLLLWSLVSLAGAADVDGDGMLDSWETSMGLNPAISTDAFADKDGDRVPNLWEYVRGTAANSASSVPAYDAVVDNSQPPSGNRYSTLQAAYDSLASGNPSYRFLVQIKRGTYPAALDSVTAPKVVAWIGEKGKTNDAGAVDASWSTQRSRGHEGVILDGNLAGGAGIQVGDEALFDGIIVANWSGYLEQDELEWYAYPSSPLGFGITEPVPSGQRPAFSILPVVPADKPEVRLVNCIIRKWRPCYLPSLAEAQIPGAIINKGGALSLVHTSIIDCVSSQAHSVGTTSFDGVTYYNYNFWYQGSVQNVPWLNQSQQEVYGDLGLINTVVWDVLTGHDTLGVIGDTTGVSFTTSAVNGVTATGNLIGPNSTYSQAGESPNITRGGYESRYARDTAAVSNIRPLANTGTPMGVLWDINGEARATTSGTIDIGADEWINTTGTGETTVDDLPDWWEFFWVGSRSGTNTSNPDNDSYPWDHPIYPSQPLTHLVEFFDGSRPLNDQDADGLTDTWETQYWVNIGAAGSSGTDDPDADTYSNQQEENQDTHPLLYTTYFDLDSDGLPDAWEWDYFGHMHFVAGDNPDGDGRTNMQEFVAGTDPTALDHDWDNDADGLMDYWEIQYFGSISAQDGDDNLVDGDSANNLAEQALGTSPLVADVLYPDTDLDGWYDYLEQAAFGDLTEGPDDDYDGDGLANRFEVEVYGTDPKLKDTNGDGVSDYNSYVLGWPAVESDPDGDGYTTTLELSQGLNPFSADSDGDGVADNLDPMPLDRTVSSAAQGVSVAGPPVLTLFSPPGAVLLP